MPPSIKYTPVNGDYNDHDRDSQSRIEVPEEWHTTPNNTQLEYVLALAFYFREFSLAR